MHREQFQYLLCYFSWVVAFHIEIKVYILTLYAIFEIINCHLNRLNCRIYRMWGRVWLSESLCMFVYVCVPYLIFDFLQLQNLCWHFLRMSINARTNQYFPAKYGFWIASFADASQCQFRVLFDRYKNIPRIQATWINEKIRWFWTICKTIKRKILKTMLS